MVRATCVTEGNARQSLERRDWQPWLDRNHPANWRCWHNGVSVVACGVLVAVTAPGLFFVGVGGTIPTAINSKPLASHLLMAAFSAMPWPS